MCSPFEFRKTSASDDDEGGFVKVDHVDEHVSRNFGVNRLANDPHIQSRSLEKGRGLTRDAQDGRLSFALIRELGGFRGRRRVRILRIDCEATCESVQI